MEKITTRTRNGQKSFVLGVFDAYIGQIFGNGRKNGYYIQLARGTQNLNKDAPVRTFRNKRKAELFIRRWLKEKHLGYMRTRKLRRR